MNKLLFAVLALASVGAANAQVKIAVINTQKALLETDDIKKAQLDLEAKFKPRQDQMIKVQKELEDIQAQLQSGKLNELGTQEINAEGQRKQRELQRMQQDINANVPALPQQPGRREHRDQVQHVFGNLVRPRQTAHGRHQRDIPQKNIGANHQHHDE